MTRQGLSAQLLKACCADLYGSDLARALMGDSLHPGGPELTRRLAWALGLGAGERVLDVACGTGASAFLLAREVGCHAVGVDYGEEQVAQASAKAGQTDGAGTVAFRRGDAEALGEAEGSYDALICECALSTFPDKAAAVAEMYRVLRPGGRVGITDVTVTGPLPPELEGVASSVACIGQALSVEGYEEAFLSQKFHRITITDCSEVLGRLVEELRRKVLLARMAVTAGAMTLEGIDLGLVQRLLQLAQEEVRRGALGYVMLTARK